MEERTSISQTGIKYGVILGIISIVYTVILYLTKLFLSSAFGFLPIIFVVGLLIIAYRDYKTQHNGLMSLGEGFRIGMIINVISTVLSGVFNYVYTKFIDPTIYDTIKDFQTAQFEQQGLSDEQIEQAMKFSEPFMNSEFGLITGVAGGLMFGAILALIISAIMKKNPDMI